jgi:hypothetical protein
MRVYHAILFLTLAALAVSQGSLVPKDCKESNFFRSKLESANKGLVLPKPDTSTLQCGQEWTTYGTCCKLDKLKTVFENDAQIIRESYAGLSSEFAGFLGLYRTFYANLKILAVADETLWKQTAQKNAIKTAKKYLVEESFVRVFDTLSDYAKEQAWHNYRIMMRICWEKNIKIRGSALCSTCSGRGYEFFKKDMAIATEKACKPIMTKCYRSIKATLRIFRAWRYLNYHVSHDLKHLDIAFNIKTKIPKLKDLITSVNEGGVANDIENISFDFKQMVKEDAKHKGRFCDMFVQLQETPLVVKIARNINQNVAWVLDFKPNIMEIINGTEILEGDTRLSDLQKSIKQKRAQIKGNDEPDNLDEPEAEEERVLHLLSSRALLATNENELFKSDTTWLDKQAGTKVDLSEQSTTKATSTSPMNLSLAFIP